MKFRMYFLQTAKSFYVVNIDNKCFKRNMIDSIEIYLRNK